MENLIFRTQIELDGKLAAQVKEAAHRERDTFVGIIRKALKRYLSEKHDGETQVLGGLEC